MKKMSVLVLTYNAVLEDLFLTLDSIMCQNIDDYEIVIADDGSKENHRDALEKYFEEKQFTDYIFQMNEQNQGTVRNVITGAEKCSGEYVKLISSGDCLFYEETLSRVYSFMKENELDYCHGLVQAFRWDENHSVQKLPYTHPFDINAYRKNEQKRIQKNLVVYSDNTCGAAICYERNFLLEYMNKIKKSVRLEEDIFQVLAVVENRKVALFDEYMVWYEVGEGVSTKKHKAGEDPLALDVDRMYHKLYELHPENRYVRQRKRLLPLYKINNLYLRTILRFFVNPDAVRYLIGAFIQKKKKAHQAKGNPKGFLDERNNQ